MVEKVTTGDIYAYYANVMDYFRVISAMYAFHIAKTSPVLFTITYFTSFILDAFDGMVARAYGQKSKLGATLDMVTDRISTAGLLCVLSGFYREWSTAFVYLIMLDVGSHWLQTHSGFLVDVKSDNHKNLEEKFWILNFYYKNRYGLGIVCLGAEIFLLMLYYLHFNMWLWDNPIFKCCLLVNFAIYALKQFISIVQILGASGRIANYDAKVATEELTQKKTG